MYRYDSAEDRALLTRFGSHLIDAGFSRIRCAKHLDHVDRFLSYLRRAGIAPEAVTPQDLSRYLRAQLQKFRREHGHGPRNPVSWRQGERGGVHRFLAFVQDRWPPQFVAAGDLDRPINAILKEYERHLREERALATGTIVGCLAEAGQFLRRLPGTDLGSSLSTLSIATIDRYVKQRAETGLARSTRRQVCNDLRAILRYLHASGRIPRDLAPAVMTPSTYRHEGLPSTITPEQIRSILTSARSDRSPTGIRNYAILLLLATYGLRAGEVCKLRLEDIDWRAGRLTIRHTKTGAETCLPLLSNVGHAILNYLRHVRPQCKDRQIFVAMHAPRRAFLSTNAIHSLLRHHLAQVGLHLNGKRGPHVFRHARAKSLLMAGVPLKTVGDLLGHRSACATAVYLKLDDERLRDIALSLPVPEATP